MARMRSSWGNVTRLPSGAWRIRYSCEGKRCSETVRGTRRQAEDRLAELRVAHGSDAQSRMTLGQAYRRWWLPDAEDRVAAGTYRQRSLDQAQSIWRVHCEPRWGSVRAASATPLKVQEWLSGLTKQNAEKAKSLMRQVCDLCVVYGALDANPFAARFRMPKAQAARDGGIYTLPQLAEVWRALRGSDAEGAFLCLAFAGCRVGEALGVRSDEVELAEVGGVPVATFPVERQVANDGGEVRDELKTPWSRRFGAVPGPMGVRLAEIASERLAEGDPWLTGDGLGEPVTQRVLNCCWDRELRAAGVERHPLRNLRRSWETFMHWDQSVDPAKIEKLMGHVGDGVTGRHYDRPQRRHFAETVAAAYAANPFADGWDVR